MRFTTSDGAELPAAPASQPIPPWKNHRELYEWCVGKGAISNTEQAWLDFCTLHAYCSRVGRKPGALLWRILTNPQYVNSPTLSDEDRGRRLAKGIRAREEGGGGTGHGDEIPDAGLPVGHLISRLRNRHTTS